jgi:tripartite-type tricarboxylate transporter receptor subunit TctC
MKATRFLLLLLIGCAAPLAAQTWPSRTVTIVVGYPAGGGSDVVARFLAEGMRERTGQPFVVENRPGIFGNLGAQYVSQAKPDGHTILYTPNSTHGANVHLFKKLGYDPVRDFQPVTTVLSAGFVLLVNPGAVPVSSVPALTDYIKARPGALAYGTNAATGRIASELYLNMAGLRNVTFVPYKSATDALMDLMRGQIHFFFVDAMFAMPQVRGGKVRALAVSNEKRFTFAKDIPTVAEGGLPGYDVPTWFALFMPAKAPREAAQKMAQLSNAIIQTEKGREFLKNLGADPYPGNPESLAKLLETEIPKWGRMVKIAGIEPE